MAKHECLPELQAAEKNWQFDIFGLAEATPGNTLSLLAFHLFKQAGHVKKFSLDEGKLCRYLRKIEQGYDAGNPYHNRCLPTAPTAACKQSQGLHLASAASGSVSSHVTCNRAR